MYSQYLYVRIQCDDVVVDYTVMDDACICYMLQLTIYCVGCCSLASLAEGRSQWTEATRGHLPTYLPRQSRSHALELGEADLAALHLVTLNVALCLARFMPVPRFKSQGVQNYSL